MYNTYDFLFLFDCNKLLLFLCYFVFDRKACYQHDRLTLLVEVISHTITTHLRIPLLKLSPINYGDSNEAARQT